MLGFTWRHWRRHSWLTTATAAALIGATVADVLMPIFAGRLVDAVGATGRDAVGATGRDVAWHAAMAALGAIMALGLVMIVLRHLAFLGIIRLSCAS